jgi:hypothetical protein
MNSAASSQGAVEAVIEEDRCCIEKLARNAYCIQLWWLCVSKSWQRQAGLVYFASADFLKDHGLHQQCFTNNLHKNSLAHTFFPLTVVREFDYKG